MAKRDPSQTSGKLEKAMETMPLEDETFLAVVLNHALEAEANFLGLYDVAIRKVDEAARRKLEEFRGDHVERVGKLRGVLDQMGAPILAEERATPVGTALARRLEEAETEDQLLVDFAVSEDFSRRLYEWVAMAPAPEPVQRLAQLARDAEERHYAWAAERAGLADEP